MSAPLNLARRPFRNERLPALAFGLALALLAAITVRQAVMIAQLLPSRTSARYAESAGLEAHVRELQRSAAALREPGPDRATVARWAVVKELVDRRAFQWTLLLSRLEGVLPDGVRLKSIVPRWEKGGMRLTLIALAQDPREGFELVQALEALPEFEDVLPTSKDPQDGGYEFQYEMRYQAQPAPPAAGVAPAAGEAR